MKYSLSLSDINGYIGEIWLQTQIVVNPAELSFSNVSIMLVL